MYCSKRLVSPKAFVFAAILFSFLISTAELRSQFWEARSGMPADGSRQIAEISNGGSGGFASLSHVTNTAGRPRVLIELRDRNAAGLLTQHYVVRANLYDKSGSISQANDGTNDIIWTSAPATTMQSAPISEIHVHRMTAAGAFVWGRNIGNVGLIDIPMAHCMTTAGNVAVVGYTQATGATTSRLFAALINGGTGALMWQGNYATPNPAFLLPAAIQENVSTNSLTIAGEIKDAAGRDVFLLDLNLLGAVNWGQRYGGVNEQFARDMIIDWAGNIVIAGHSFNAATGPESYLVKTNSTGGLLVQRRYLDLAGSDNLAEGVCVNLTNDGYVFTGAVEVQGTSQCIAVAVSRDLRVNNQAWYDGEIGTDIVRSLVGPVGTAPGYYIGGIMAADNYFIRMRSDLTNNCEHPLSLDEVTHNGSAPLIFNRQNATIDRPRNYNKFPYDNFVVFCGPFPKEALPGADYNEPAVPSALRLSPNPAPAGASLTIHLSAMPDGPLRLTISDLLGRRVYSADYELAAGMKSLSIDKLSLNSGSYQLSVAGLQATVSTPLVISD